MNNKQLNNIKELYNRSTDSHNIMTPISLCDEMINSLNIDVKDDKSMLVVSNIEFLIALKKKGINMYNVHYTVSCPIKKQVANKIGVSLNNIHNLEYNNKEINFGTPENMKFDYIIQNPPYQHFKNKSFYTNFIKICNTILENNGYLLSVNPHSWFNKSLFNYMLNNGDFKIIKQLDGKEIFNINMGSALHYFLYNKTNIKGNYNLIELDKFKIDDKHNKIIEKIYKNDFITAKTGKGQNEFKPNKDNEYIYPVYLSSKSDRKLLYSNKKMPGTNVNKLICSIILTPGKATQFSEFSYEKGVGRYSKYFECTQQESINIINFFNSKIYQYIDRIKRVGRYAYLCLPNLDWTQEWTDDKLIDFFNLTDEEVQNIEEIINTITIK